MHHNTVTQHDRHHFNTCFLCRPQHNDTHTHTHKLPVASTGFLLISPAEGAEVFGSSVSENRQHLLKEIISDTNKSQQSQRSAIVFTAARVDDTHTSESSSHRPRRGARARTPSTTSAYPPLHLLRLLIKMNVVLLRLHASMGHLTAPLPPTLLHNVLQT